MEVKVSVPTSVSNIENAVVHKASFASEAKLVDLLRSHYSFSIRTPTQEYLCNARDSHREANKMQVAIDVFLPTKTNPVFKIRDYGVGMSAQRLIENFFSYGGSTKTSNNNQTGGFGIGSKSAFIYTNTFFVRNIFDGVETLYEASIAVHYAGALRPMSEKKTKEDTGVEIIIPVEVKDIESFINAFYRATYFWTDQSVNVVNLKADELAEEFVNRTIVETDNYYFHNQHSNFFETINYDSDCIVLDGIIYSVADSMPANKENAIQSHVMVPKFKTGELNVSISRESIEDGDELKTKLKKRFCDQNKIALEFKAAMSQVLEKDFKFTKYEHFQAAAWNICEKYHWLKFGYINDSVNDLSPSLNAETLELSVRRNEDSKFIFGIDDKYFDLSFPAGSLNSFDFYKNKNNRLSYDKNERRVFNNPCFLINDLGLSAGKVEELIKDFPLLGKNESLVVVNNFHHPRIQNIFKNFEVEKLSVVTRGKNEEIKVNAEKAKKVIEEQRKLAQVRSVENAEVKRIRKIQTYCLEESGEFRVSSRIVSYGNVVCSLEDGEAKSIARLYNYLSKNFVFVSPDDLAFLESTDKVQITTKEELKESEDYKKTIKKFAKEYSVRNEVGEDQNFVMSLLSKDEGYDWTYDLTDSVAEEVMNNLNLKVNLKLQEQARKITSNPFYSYFRDTDLDKKTINDLREKLGL